MTDLDLNKEFCAQIVTYEITRGHNIEIVRKQTELSWFKLEDLARRYDHDQTLYQDHTDNHLNFAIISKEEKAFSYTNIYCTLNEEDTQTVWNWYVKNRQKQWKEERSKRKFNRDTAIKYMSTGSPLYRAKTAMKYPEYQHLVPVDKNYAEYQKELRKLQEITNVDDAEYAYKYCK